MSLGAPPLLTAGPMITPAPLFPRAVTTAADTELSFCEEFLQDCAKAVGDYEGFESAYIKCDNTNSESPMAFCIGCPAGTFKTFDACFNHEDSYPVQVPEYSQQMWIGLTPKNAAKAPAGSLETALKPSVDKWSQRCAKQCKKDYASTNDGASYYAWYGTRDYTIFSCGCSPEEFAAPRPFNISGLDLVPALDGLPDDDPPKKAYAVGADRWGAFDRAASTRPKKIKKDKKTRPNAGVDEGISIRTGKHTVALGGRGKKRRTETTIDDDDDKATRTRRSRPPATVPTIRIEPIPGLTSMGPVINPNTLRPEPVPTAAPRASPAPPPPQPRSSPAPVPVVSPSPPKASPTPSPSPEEVMPTPTAVSPAPVLPWNATATKEPNGCEKAAGIKVAVASVAVIMSLVAALF
ncbi:hypothetical protein HDU96_000605 [Phlyctochytrium bullatum]|nr:hypothetical protein HDU96_000605 [Phlyctochytrium bullatum]